MKEQVQRPTDGNRPAWYAYWTALGMSWRTEPEIDPQRQAYLNERRICRPNIEDGIYPYRGVDLSRADVEWLLATDQDGEFTGAIDPRSERRRHRKGLDLRGAHLSRLDLRRLPLSCIYGVTEEEFEDVTWLQLQMARIHFEEADLRGAHLEQSDLAFACMDGCELDGAHLEGADLRQAEMRKASIEAAYLEGCDLQGAHLEEVDASGAHLENADLRATHMIGASLQGAHLEGSRLNSAELDGADLQLAHLEGTSVQESDLTRIRSWVPDFPATLPPADLRRAQFGRATYLSGSVGSVCLGTSRGGFVPVADVQWGGVNLAAVPLPLEMSLGDELQARQSRSKGKRKDRRTRIRDYEAAVRSVRQLATALRDQGQEERANRLAYRGHVLQRQVYRRMGVRSWGAYFGSLLLDIIAGYGYHPLRSFLVYLIAVVWFANAYHGFSLPSLDALVFSVASFHGRGFFPSESFTLHSPIAMIAALEAVFGLLIEITFIATFTQRFFAR